jgi:virginiamycin B lyase
MRAACGLLAILFSAVAVAQLPARPTLDYWEVPWADTRPRDPAVDRDGLVWFVGQTGDYVGSFDPRNERFRRIALETGTGPHNLIVGEDRSIWYAGNRAAHIGRVDPVGGKIEKIAMPEGVRDPHTLAADGKGHIWFTAQGASYIGRLTLASRKVEPLKLPQPNWLPYGIVIDDAGRPWANLLGTSKLATVDPASFALQLIDLPRSEARTRRIAVASDGAIWYTDYAAAHIGRYDPKTKQFKEWRPPTGDKARPYAMAIDDRARVWFADSGVQPNRLMALDTGTGRFVVDVEVDNARGAIRHMVFDEATRALWFGTDTGFLVRVRVP